MAKQTLPKACSSSYKHEFEWHEYTMHTLSNPKQPVPNIIESSMHFRFSLGSQTNACALVPGVVRCAISQQKQMFEKFLA